MKVGSGWHRWLAPDYFSWLSLLSSTTLARSSSLLLSSLSWRCLNRNDDHVEMMLRMMMIIQMNMMTIAQLKMMMIHLTKSCGSTIKLVARFWMWAPVCTKLSINYTAYMYFLCPIFFIYSYFQWKLLCVPYIFPYWWKISLPIGKLQCATYWISDFAENELSGIIYSVNCILHNSECVKYSIRGKTYFAIDS